MKEWKERGRMGNVEQRDSYREIIRHAEGKKK